MKHGVINNTNFMEGCIITSYNIVINLLVVHPEDSINGVKGLQASH